MSWFRKKITVEDFVSDVVREKLPMAVQFFDKENNRAHHTVPIQDQDLLTVGAGMVLFFMGKFLPDSNPENLKLMSRAYRHMEKLLPSLDITPQAAYRWWKAYTDTLIFQENEARLKIACRLTWEKLIPNKPYREASPLRSFGYYLEMEVEALAKARIV
jgi:hypothetical protein